ncbi:Cardiolipin synthase [Oligella ureolytica]
MGSIKLRRSFMKSFEDAGGHLCYFHKLGIGGLSSLINFRNHRKIAICDGKIAFTGGVKGTIPKIFDLTQRPITMCTCALKDPL